MSNKSSTETSVQPLHFTAQKNGVIRVARDFDNITGPYTKADEIPDYLAVVDHSLVIEDKKDYQKQLDVEEEKFNLLVRRMQAAKKFLVVVLQGRDGAGKSGATICIGNSLGHDAKLFLSVPIGPPTEDERAHPPLWRFFKDDRMPAFGQVRVFDRSWAEEVLVVRVNKIKPKEAWQASYASLRTMDWMLEQEGGIVVKLWLDITKDEQKARFKKRAEEKPWKVSPSDAEARSKWSQYTKAANEMFFRTGTEYSPWFIIASEDKRYSRVNVLRTLNQQLREALGDEKKK
jgi:polyphosphate kinase 2 (PPK2 family)